MVFRYLTSYRRPCFGLVDDKRYGMETILTFRISDDCRSGWCCRPAFVKFLSFVIQGPATISDSLKIK